MRRSELSDIANRDANLNTLELVNATVSKPIKLSMTPVALDDTRCFVRFWGEKVAKMMLITRQFGMLIMLELCSHCNKSFSELMKLKSLFCNVVICMFFLLFQLLPTRRTVSSFNASKSTQMTHIVDSSHCSLICCSIAHG